ncbi:hypothetical protein L484_000200 [Morus notabilis]|uniref:Uncharacterized protein n=1 Tax=Morus notabilis TaxID=981085 RepID=W9T2D3_9ROSA|nr:hypothetical protein L484_000200 [Morus notabilis]
MDVTTINITTVGLSNTGSEVNYESDQFANRASSPCRCSGRRRPQVEATDALVIQLTPCRQSVLAVMLAKVGVSAGFTYYWI